MKYRVIHQLKERNFERQVSKSEAAVLDYLEINFKSIPNYTAVKVSEESFTSQATLNRACKLLGFKGFSELKYAIMDDLSSMNSSVERHSSKTEYILGKIDFDSGVKLAEALYQGRRKVMLFGLGSSHISALYLQRQLLYLGYSSHAGRRDADAEEVSGLYTDHFIQFWGNTKMHSGSKRCSQDRNEGSKHNQEGFNPHENQLCLLPP